MLSGHRVLVARARVSFKTGATVGVREAPLDPQPLPSITIRAAIHPFSQRPIVRANAMHHEK